MRIYVCYRLSNTNIMYPKMGRLGVLRVEIWKYSVLTHKRYFLEWFHVFWVTTREHLSTALTCSRWREKKYKKSFRCYISPFSPEASRYIDFYKSWYGGISPGRNHILTISLKPVNGFWTVRGRISTFHIGSLLAVNTALQYRAARDFKVTILLNVI